MPTFLSIESAPAEARTDAVDAARHVPVEMPGSPARVLLLSAAAGKKAPAYALDDLQRMRRFARQDVHRLHKLADSAAEADVILFVERAGAAGPFMERVRRHPYTRQYPGKVFVFNSRYTGVPFLPGFYAQIGRRDLRLHPYARVTGAPYLEVCEADHLEHRPATGQEPLLYSFIGSRSTWPQVRGPVLDLKDDRAYLEDASQYWNRCARRSIPVQNREAHQADYVRALQDAKFGLCPRGDAYSSMRLFETMRMGRVPVIISDEWIPPSGPAWDRFSVRIPEAEVHRIPEILRALETEAPVMGREARAVWQRYFSAEGIFHWCVTWCLRSRQECHTPERLARLLAYAGLLRRRQARAYVRTRLDLLKRGQFMF